VKFTTRAVLLAMVLVGFFNLVGCSKKAPEKTASTGSTAATNGSNTNPSNPTTSTPPVPAGPSAATSAASATSESTTSVATLTPALLVNFDWSTVPEAGADIGVYPYFKAPEGMQVGSESGKLSKTGFTSEKAFDKRVLFADSRFFLAEGKVTLLNFQMANGSQNFENALFDKNYETYFESIGAKLLFKGKIPSEKLDELEKKEGFTSAQYLPGGWRGDSPIRIYALKKLDKKILVQFFSNSAQGTLAFVEIKDFKMTVSKYTAAGMQKEIEATGKAILDINFDTGKSTLGPQGLDVVTQITALLKNNPSLKLSIEGHTDNVGIAASNKTLSDERAKTVMLLLITNGISKESLKAVGYGAEKPLVPNDSDVNKAKNRRVELVKF
jgi:OmpA-OmpF porin, OOP family